MSTRVRRESTRDGSDTLYSERFESHYHSIHGALQESMHVFIKEGLHRCEGDSLNVLEFGLGTGLNALLTCSQSLELNLDIRYRGLELYPVERATLSELEYVSQLGAPNLAEYWDLICDSPWGTWIPIADNRFRLFKDKSNFLTADLGNEIDLVYFDAFAPDSQPELWTVAMYERIYAAMREGGIMSTYCSKGDVRRAMITAGFRVEKHPGPPGKREILVAFK